MSGLFYVVACLALCGCQTVTRPAALEPCPTLPGPCDAPDIEGGGFRLTPWVGLAVRPPLFITCPSTSQVVFHAVRLPGETEDDPGMVCDPPETPLMRADVPRRGEGRRGPFNSQPL